MFTPFSPYFVSISFSVNLYESLILILSHGSLFLRVLSGSLILTPPPFLCPFFRLYNYGKNNILHISYAIIPSYFSWLILCKWELLFILYQEIKFLKGKAWFLSRVTRNTNLQEKNNKRVFPLWCFLFLWFKTSPAMVEWQYFKHNQLDTGCFHI